MSDKNHPLWSVLRMAIMAAAAVGALHFNYSGLDRRDVLTVLEIVAVTGGMDWLRKRKAE